MRIILVENTDAARLVNKDQMGGYGIGSQYGRRLGSRLLGRFKRAGRRIPLLTFGYLAAILERNGHAVSVYSDGDGSVPDGDLFLIASSIVESDAEVRFVHRVRATGARVGVVGPFAASRPDVYLPHADFVVRGEPERWASGLADGDRPSGLVESPQVDDLDALPFPSWKAFDLDRYGYWPILLDKPFVPVLASRGCSFTCSYCPYIVQYPQWRMRTPDNVVAELEQLVTRWGVRSVLFRDPLFTQGKGRAEAIARRLIAAGLHRRLTWACETRTDLLNEALLELMVRAGLRGLNVGIESSDADVLHSANRRQSHERSARIIRHAEALGVKVAAFYVLGLPSDTAATIAATLAQSRRLNTFAAQFHVNTPFPGTPMYEQYRDAVFARSWSEFTSFDPVFTHPNLTPDELTAWKERAYGGYYYRAAWVQKHWRSLLPAMAPRVARDVARRGAALGAGRRRRATRTAPVEAPVELATPTTALPPRDAVVAP